MKWNDKKKETLICNVPGKWVGCLNSLGLPLIPNILDNFKPCLLVFYIPNLQGIRISVFASVLFTVQFAFILKFLSWKFPSCSPFFPLRGVNICR